MAVADGDVADLDLTIVWEGTGGPLVALVLTSDRRTTFHQLVQSLLVHWDLQAYDPGRSLGTSPFVGYGLRLANGQMLDLDLSLGEAEEIHRHAQLFMVEADESPFSTMGPDVLAIRVSHPFLTGQVMVLASSQSVAVATLKERLEEFWELPLFRAGELVHYELRRQDRALSKDELVPIDDLRAECALTLVCASGPEITEKPAILDVRREGPGSEELPKAGGEQAGPPAQVDMRARPLSAGPRRTYLDFEVQVTGATGKYETRVLKSPAGEGKCSMVLRPDHETLTIWKHRSRVAQLPLPQVLHEEPSRKEIIRNLGEFLFDALFAGDVLRRYGESRGIATNEKAGLRLRLRIEPPELALLPWEFMYDGSRSRYLCLSRDTPLTRYPAVQEGGNPLITQPPLRILAMAASPHGWPQLDVAAERERIDKALEKLRKLSRVDLAWVEGQSWRDLQQALWEKEWNVLHFIGHGGFDGDEGFLVLTDESNQKQRRISATELADLLDGLHSLRLVVLNACEGARGNQDDIFSSTAAALIDRGVSAVLAMQYRITDEAAIELARTFYGATAHGMPVDGAVTEARLAIKMAVTDPTEWGTPVLYMRSPNGVLVDLASDQWADHAHT